MGNYLSRGFISGRSSTPDEDPSASAAYTYPPKNASGYYFASHFIMGGERFDSPQPESFLFGENTDLNFLGPKPVSFPYPPPQANEPTKTLRSQINVRRDSVHFVAVRDEEAEGEGEAGEPRGRRYRVHFTLDSDVSCAVTLVYFCREEVAAAGASYVSTRRDLTSDTYTFGRGSNQAFSQPVHVFDPSLCQDDLEKAREDADLISLAIHCVSLEGEHPRWEK